MHDPVSFCIATSTLNPAILLSFAIRQDSGLVIAFFFNPIIPASSLATPVTFCPLTLTFQNCII
jgi:hypothetical protein